MPLMNSAAPLSSSPLSVTRKNDAFHLVTNDAVAAGQCVFTIKGDVVSRPSRYSVQIGRDQHIDLVNPPSLKIMIERHPWCFMNHSCEPDVRIAGRNVIALRAIRAGEEIAFDYDTTEWDMAEGFRCHCGSAQCRGEIRGYKWLSPGVRARLRNAVAPHLLHR